MESSRSVCYTKQAYKIITIERKRQPMKKSYLIGIIVLTILLGAWFFAQTRDNASLLYENNPAVTGSAQDPVAQGVAPAAGTDNSTTAGNNPQGQTPDTTETVVIYTEQGFIPETVTVKKGEAVTFKNKSGRNMWVGSNPHPTHTLYPEKSPSDCLGSSFDACKGTPAGSDWSYAFNSTGTWRYHDHLQPENQGTVIVQ